MPKQFDALRERLLRAGVAPLHVRRYLAELDDHLDELKREGVAQGEALARLGSVEHLAKPMLDRREFRSWTAKAPWAVMLLGPILTMILAVAALGLIVVGQALVYRWIAPWPGRVEPAPLQMIVRAAAAFAVFVLPLMIGWAAAAIAIQQRLPPLWPLIGLALFAFVSGTFGLEVTFAKVLGESNELSFGFGRLNPASSLFDPMDISPVRWIANLALLLGPYLAWRRWGHAAPREARTAGLGQAAYHNN